MKRTRKLWIAALFGVGVGHAAARSAEPDVVPAGSHFGRQAGPACYPSGPCPPGTYVPNPFIPNPYSPSPFLPNPVNPNVPNPPVQPMLPNQVPAPTPLPSSAMDPGAGGQGTSRGTEAAVTNAPNLFGDLLGTRSIIIPKVLPLSPGASTGKTFNLRVPASGVGPQFSDGLPVNLSGTRMQLTGASGGVAAPSAPLGVTGSFVEQGKIPAPINQKFPTSNGGVLNPLVQYLVVPKNAQVLPTPQIPGGSVPSNIQGAGYNYVQQFEKQQNPQARLVQLTVGPVEAFYNGEEILYGGTVTSQVQGVRPAVAVAVPNPISGGVVGQLKLSEDNSPFPRDRLIFTYDYFDAVPLGTSGIPVNRYQFGFEKTFLDGRFSFEFRLPFANTLDTTSTLGADNLGTELGNLRLSLKGLILRGNTFNFAAGFAVSLPTSNDITVQDVDGSEILSVQNTSVQLSPYLAVILTPNDRCFAQAWYGFTFDTGGNNLRINPLVFGIPSTSSSLVNSGTLGGQVLMSADLQLGYWLFRSNEGFMQGFAPFVEFHYNSQISSSQTIKLGTTTVTNISQPDELNLATGFITQLWDNTNLSVGLAAPLLGNTSRTFDYQVGVRLNWYFGHTARNRSNAAMVQSFQ